MPEITTTTEALIYCGSCGEREGSVYAKHCCTEDNMIVEEMPEVDPDEEEGPDPDVDTSDEMEYGVDDYEADRRADAYEASFLGWD